MCSCLEGKITYTDGRGSVDTHLNVHDCDYIVKRNELIPRAERLATMEIGKDRNTDKSAAWSLAFHRHMTKLAESLHE